jgi:hypothetical protein
MSERLGIAIKEEQPGSVLVQSYSYVSEIFGLNENQGKLWREYLSLIVELEFSHFLQTRNLLALSYLVFDLSLFALLVTGTFIT